mmetsp:Transcript_14084/g.35986  ORF Transcript_14084/g.35986 Transcript_14084/m.35986 type:complete len:249 (-) Transcript_14084:215-961(-)
MCAQLAEIVSLALVPREGGHVAAERASHHHHQVAHAAHAHHAHTFSGAAVRTQRSEGGEPGAHERSRSATLQRLGQSIDEATAHVHQTAEAAAHAHHALHVGAQLLVAACALPTAAAAARVEADTHPVAHLQVVHLAAPLADHAHRLVAGHQRVETLAPVVGEHVCVAGAQSTVGHLHLHLVRSQRHAHQLDLAHHTRRCVLGRLFDVAQTCGGYQLKVVVTHRKKIKIKIKIKTRIITKRRRTQTTK